MHCRLFFLSVYWFDPEPTASSVRRAAAPPRLFVELFYELFICKHFDQSNPQLSNAVTIHSSSFKCWVFDQKANYSLSKCTCTMSNTSCQIFATNHNSSFNPIKLFCFDPNAIFQSIFEFPARSSLIFWIPSGMTHLACPPQMRHYYITTTLVVQLIKKTVFF